MKPPLRLILLPFLFLANLSVEAAKPSRNNDRVEAKGSPARATTELDGTREPWLRVVISEEERRIIRGYYREPGVAAALPPGLQKKVARGGALPPGWEKRMCRGECLPEEVYARAHPLPEEVERRLPASDRAVITVVVEGKVVRLLRATREILDVFEL